jgi:SAM-dependent methyltransferase
VSSDPAFETYEAFAPIYNDFNHLNDYEAWLGGALLPELERHGLRVGRVLDVGCGTGRAFGPLLRRGWEIHGTDISPAMLEVAAREGEGRVATTQADMRELPRLGEFELVISMNDAINYLLGDGDLERALAGMRSNLAADGLLLFDANSALQFEEAFGETEQLVTHGGRRWRWRGLGPESGAGPIYAARIDGDGIDPIVNRERLYDLGEVKAAMAAAGLECVATLGQREDDGRIIISDPPDEARDYKVVYVGRTRGG